MRLQTLKRRAEYQRVRGGGRWGTSAFVMEGKARPPSSSPVRPGEGITGPRFGFTVTRQMGGAVARNRIRRRLKAAVAKLVATHARAEYDYVIIARPAALDRPFSVIEQDLVIAFGRVHEPPRRGSRKGPDRAKPD